MHTLSGEEFEEFVGKYLMELGYIIQATPKTGDGGIDFHAWRNDGEEYAVVQCKNWSSPVGAREVRELYGTMMANKANRAILITSSDFTRQAREFAMLCDELVLISGETLIQTLRKSA
jgi:restriction system protein